MSSNGNHFPVSVQGIQRAPWTQMFFDAAGKDLLLEHQEAVAFVRREATAQVQRSCARIGTCSVAIDERMVEESASRFLQTARLLSAPVLPMTLEGRNVRISGIAVVAPSRGRTFYQDFAASVYGEFLRTAPWFEISPEDIRSDIAKRLENIHRQPPPLSSSPPYWSAGTGGSVTGFLIGRAKFGSWGGLIGILAGAAISLGFTFLFASPSNERQDGLLCSTPSSPNEESPCRRLLAQKNGY